MQDFTNPYASPYSVAKQTQDVRSSFIKKTYSHLALAIALFAAIEYALFQIPGIENTVFSLLAKSKYSWLIVLGGMMGVSWIAEKWANSNTSRPLQYLGLGLYTLGQAIMFLPLLLIASQYVPANGGSSVIFTAGLITVALTIGLTMIAFTTKKDFSFLNGMLKVGFLVALGAIVCSIIFGFNLGVFFSSVMVLLCAGSILSQTSAIMYHYNPTQYVAASLGLFASVTLLFWYILRIVMSFSSSD